MTDWTKEQRAMAAAHLCDLAGVANREGHRFTAGQLAEAAAILSHGESADPSLTYRAALTELSRTTEAIDNAVASILRGEHPADSLPGRVEAMYKMGKRGAAREGQDQENTQWYLGNVRATGDVLEMLGVKTGGET